MNLLKAFFKYIFTKDDDEDTSGYILDNRAIGFEGGLIVGEFYLDGFTKEAVDAFARKVKLFPIYGSSKSTSAVPIGLDDADLVILDVTYINQEVFRVLAKLRSKAMDPSRYRMRGVVRSTRAQHGNRWKLIIDRYDIEQISITEQRK